MEPTAESVDVLIVDDEPDFADVVAEFLEREDDRIDGITATSAEEGLDVLSQSSVDCIVSDYDMPRRNGIEFLRSVRRERPDLPFILYTGKGSEAVASEAISTGLTDYLQKSGSPEDYRLLANRILDAVAHVRSQTSYEEVFEKIPDGVVIHDVDGGEFVDMNERYAEMYGYTKEEFLELGFEAIHPDESPYTIERAREHVRTAVENGAHTFEWRAVERDGSRFWAEVHLTPVTLHGRDRILAAVRDITERRAYQEQLERQNRRLDEFASVVSHDLRNPLSVAEARLERAREEFESDHLDATREAHRRMRRLIDDLLAVAREGSPDPDTGEIDVAEIAESCWRTTIADGGNLEVADRWTVVADGSRIRRLLENLFRNAIEHSEEPVTVTVGRMDGGFYVADDGPGIPEEERDDVFEPGYTTAPDGTGFGLKIVKEIVEAHGWSVSVTESDAGGARFEFTGVES